MELFTDKNAFSLRPLKKEDNPTIAAIIKAVMPEFGADGDGFAIHDAEVNDMYAAYNRDDSAYFVVEKDGKVVGGGGIAPLQGGNKNICELKKMYFLEEARGLGIGQKLIILCLDAAKERGFQHCYLETLGAMAQARALYRKNGFEQLAGPMGNTGHHGCNSWFIKHL